MLIVLPPSETKAIGGDGPALDPTRLSFPELNPVRERIVRDLLALPPEEMQSALGLSDRMFAEVEANLELLDSPTMPAVHRYTGVLFDALDATTLDAAALDRLAVGSALFGVVGAGDLIPRYRLSGGARLPAADGAAATMKARWGTALTEALSGVDDLVVDLRSGAYRQLGPVPGAVTVRVESVQPDGSRKVVSHFNKKHKGELARLLAQSDDEATDIGEVAAIARAGGFEVEETGSTELTLVV